MIINLTEFLWFNTSSGGSYIDINIKLELKII